MNKDEKSLTELYEATLSPLNGVGLGPHAQDSAGGLGSPTLTKIDIQDVEATEDEEREQIDDHEVDMAKSELYKLAEYAPKLLDLIKNYDELEGWVQAKLTKASDYVSDIYHYLKYEDEMNVHSHEVDVVPPSPCGGPAIEVDIDEEPPGEMGEGESKEERQGINNEVIKMLMSRF
jgi:hypothetical protein